MGLQFSILPLEAVVTTKPEVLSVENSENNAKYDSLLSKLNEINIF